MKVIEFLQGKKTYIVGGAALLVVGLWIGGIVDDTMAAQALSALGFGGVITLRAGMKTGA